MKKEATLCFLAALMLLLTAVSATAAGDLNIKETSVILTGNYSTTVTGNFTVLNTGSTAMPLVTLGKASLLGSDGKNNISLGQVSFSPSTFSLDAGGNKTVQFSVAVPSNQFAQLYTASFNATDIAIPANHDSVSVALTVEAKPDFTMSSSTPSIVQGKSGKLNVTVTNTGNADITNAIYKFSDTFSNGGASINYAEVSAGLVSIPFGKTKDMLLTFNVPSGQQTGTYTGAVNLSSGSLSKVSSLSVSVQAENKQISTTTLQNGAMSYNRNNGQVLAASKKSFKFNVTNTGNVDLSSITVQKVSLTSGSNTISSSQLSLDVSSFSLNKGTSQILTVSTVGLDSINLSSGTYTGAFVINYGASSTTTMTVQFDVSDAVASVSFPDVTLPEGKRGTTQNTSFVISNTGAFPLTNIQVTASDFASGSNISITSIPNSLAVGANDTVYVSAYISSSQSAGVKKLATLNFNSNEKTATSSLNSNVATKLKISKVKVTLDGDSDTINSDGTTVDGEIMPGKEFKVEVTLENRFTDAEDVDIEDITIDVVFEEAGEDEDDIEGDADIDKINADEDEKVTINFGDDDTIGSDVDEGTYRMVITAEGETDDNGDHEDEWILYVKVDRENKVDLEFSNVEISPSTVSCFRTSYLTIEGKNLGKKDDSRGKLVIESDKLGLDEEYSFDIGTYNDDDCDMVSNEDDGCSEIDHSETIKVADSVSAGTYPIQVTWYYKSNQRGDTETVNLKVEDCGSSSSGSSSGSSSSGTSSGTSGTSGSSTSGTSSGTGTSGTSTSGSTTGSTSSGLDIQFASGSGTSLGSGSGQVYASPPTTLTDTTKKSFKDSTGYIILLVLLNLVVIIVVISLVAGLSKKK
jgi:hypothetical protein